MIILQHFPVMPFWPFDDNVDEDKQCVYDLWSCNLWRRIYKSQNIKIKTELNDTSCQIQTNTKLNGFVKNCFLLPASLFAKYVFPINQFLLRHRVPCKIYQTHEDITAIVNVTTITREIIAVNFAAIGLVTTVTAYASQSGRCAPVTYSIAMIVNTFTQNTIDSEFFYLNEGIFLIITLFLLTCTLFWCNWLKV